MQRASFHNAKVNDCRGCGWHAKPLAIEERDHVVEVVGTSETKRLRSMSEFMTDCRVAFPVAWFMMNIAPVLTRRLFLDL
jgi:hypothetical protein